MAIKASSYERFNGGIATKRKYGSSTVTRFYVYHDKDKNDPSKWLQVETRGPTPGDRKTAAIQGFEQREGNPLAVTGHGWLIIR